MKKSSFSLICLSVACASLFVHSATAQESVAAGTLNHEASWSALQTLINQAKGDIKLIRTDVDAGKACGEKDKIWNPKKGCVQPVIDLSDLEDVIDCGKKGQVFDKAKKACATVGARWYQSHSLEFQTSASNMSQNISFSEAWSMEERYDMNDYFGSYAVIRQLQKTVSSIPGCSKGMIPAGRTCPTKDAMCYLEQRESVKVGSDSGRAIAHVQLYTCG